MYIESIEGLTVNRKVPMVCDVCSKPYNGVIKIALKHIELFGHHECAHCSHVRGGKKTAAKMSKIYSQWYSGDGNPAKKPGVGKKISDALKGIPFTEEHKQSLRKPKSPEGAANIKLASQCPKLAAGRRERMLKDNPSKRPEVRKKISESVSELMVSGKFYRSLDAGFVETTKTIKPIWCRSNLEKRFLESCDKCETIKLIESAEYLRIPYEFEGKKHKYLPDFMVSFNDGSRSIVEIKSSYFQTFANWEAKLSALRVYSVEVGVSYFVLNEKEVEKWVEQRMQ